jgi:hypothetical protein
VGSQLGRVLRVPTFGLDIVAQRRIDVFHGEKLVCCEATEDMRCRKQNIPVVECERDEQVVDCIEFVRDEELRR